MDSAAIEPTRRRDDKATTKMVSLSEPHMIWVREMRGQRTGSKEQGQVIATLHPLRRSSRATKLDFVLCTAGLGKPRVEIRSCAYGIRVFDTPPPGASSYVRQISAQCRTRYDAETETGCGKTG